MSPAGSWTPAAPGWVLRSPTPSGSLAEGHGQCPGAAWLQPPPSVCSPGEQLEGMRSLHCHLGTGTALPRPPPLPKAARTAALSPHGRLLKEWMQFSNWKEKELGEVSSCARQGQAVLSLCRRVGNEPFPALCSVQGELCARQLPLSCSAPASFPHAPGPSLPDVRILGQQAECSAKLKSSSQAWRCPRLTPPFSHPPRHPGCVCAQPGLQGASSSSSRSRSTACPRWEPRGPGESWVFPKIWSQLPKMCLSRCVWAAPLPARARVPHAHGVSPLEGL